MLNRPIIISQELPTWINVLTRLIGIIMPNENQPLVYFFAKSNFGDNQPDFIKIGRTIINLSKPEEGLKRLKTLQTGNEAKIWEMGVLPFDTVDEASTEENRIHSQFGAFRREGEWFIATPRLLKFVKHNAVQHTDLFTEDDPTEKEDAVDMSFGERLAKARNAAGMTQVELAEKVGCSRGYIALIEQNRGRPGKSLYRKLDELFDLESFDTPTKTKSGSSLAVKMEDGSWISECKPIDTFIKVIEEIGIENVKVLDIYTAKIPLIADIEYPDKRQRKVETKTRTYYIFAGLANVTKKKILETIDDRLNLNIEVYINKVK